MNRLFLVLFGCVFVAVLAQNYCTGNTKCTLKKSCTEYLKELKRPRRGAKPRTARPGRKEYPVIKKPPEKKTFQLCGKVGKVRKVCCNDSNSVTQLRQTYWQTPNIAPVRDRLLRELNKDQENMLLTSPILPKWDECGIQSEDGMRILVGNITLPYEFPWMVLIQSQRGDGKKVFNCGGSLISKRYVLTAAHCVVGKNIISVRVGEYNITDDGSNDCPPNHKCPKPQDILIEKIIPHEKYKQVYYDYDIALIRLQQDAIFNGRTVQPICLLNMRKKLVNSDRRIWVSGWGLTEHGARSDVKLKISVPYQPMSMCQQIFQIGLNNARQFCAGGEDNKDACYSDRGGPVMVPYVRNQTTKWFQIGILSFDTINCGQNGYPAVYTNLNGFTDWITNTIY